MGGAQGRGRGGGGVNENTWADRMTLEMYRDVELAVKCALRALRRLLVAVECFMSDILSEFQRDGGVLTLGPAS